MVVCSADDAEETPEEARNVASVFPTESRVLESRTGGGGIDDSAASRFISETQVSPDTTPLSTE